MPVTTSKQDVLSVIDLLQERRFVHIFCRLDDSLPALAQIVANYVDTMEADPGEHMEWRATVVGGTFALPRELVKLVQKRVSLPKSRMWDASVRGKYGSLRAIGPYPEALQGIISWNLFYVVLRNHNEDIWNALWPSVIADTRILAVNCELFSEKGEFAYVDWGE